MKHKKIAFAWIGILMIVVFSMSGCKSESNGKSAANTATPTPGTAVKTDDMAEQWVYIHDRTVPAMILYKDGTASFDGVKYKSYEVLENTVRFTSESGDVVSIRYFDETKNGENRRTVYRITDYKLKPSKLTGDSPVIGYWNCPEKNWSYQFTANGTFLEDGVLPGYYYVNDDGTIRLRYDGQLPETVFYYSIHDDVMTVEYPWVTAMTP